MNRKKKKYETRPNRIMVGYKSKADDPFSLEDFKSGSFQIKQRGKIQ